MSFEIRSQAFAHGESIPREHTREGEDLSPRLHWRAPPAGTRSLALTVVDPDGTDGAFTHWVLFDIPPDVSALESGETGIGVAGRNDFGILGWGGPLPPRHDRAHRYVFRLHAVDVPRVGLEEGVPREAVERALHRHVLARAELVGLYGRGSGAPELEERT